MNREDFEPYVGKVFHLNGQSRALVLHQVMVSPHPGQPEGRAPFTLIFQEPQAGSAAPEGLYLCDIEGGPSHSLYIMPIHTPDPKVQAYQAVFG